MSIRRDAGYIVCSDPGQDKPIFESKTLQCVHCGAHWIPKPGSGRVRGFCMRCNGPICGPGCQECVPQEKMLDILEGRVNPTAVSEPVLWTPGGE